MASSGALLPFRAPAGHRRPHLALIQSDLRERNGRQAVLAQHRGERAEAEA